MDVRYYDRGERRNLYWCTGTAIMLFVVASKGMGAPIGVDRGSDVVTMVRSRSKKV